MVGGKIMKECCNCGYEWEDEEEFCIKCGSGDFIEYEVEE